MAGDDLASEAKRGADAVRARDAGRGAMDIDDLAGEEDPPKCPRGGRAAPPGVVAGLGDPEGAAGVAHVVPSNPARLTETGRAGIGPERPPPRMHSVSVARPPQVAMRRDRTAWVNVELVHGEVVGAAGRRDPTVTPRARFGVTETTSKKLKDAARAIRTPRRHQVSRDISGRTAHPRISSEGELLIGGRNPRTHRWGSAPIDSDGAGGIDPPNEMLAANGSSKWAPSASPAPSPAPSVTVREAPAPYFSASACASGTSSRHKNTPHERGFS